MRSALLCMLMLLSSSAYAVDRACSWIFEPTADRENILFPELTTRYLAAIIPAPPGGGHVEVSGEFPHARYMSLQTYTSTLQGISNLHDAQIVPDAGSSNPYLPGANRRAVNRHYTVRVFDEQVPETDRPPNTLYYRHADGVQAGRVLVYRIYVPDAGTDRFGDAPVPSLTLVMPDGARVPVPECPDVKPDTSLLTLALAQSGLSDYPAPPLGLTGQAQPEWRKYVNAPTGYFDMFTNNEILGPLNPTLREIGLALPAGLGENADNKYVYTGLSREFGDVALLRAQMPITPKTYNGEPIMGAGQMRFWSMCAGNRSSQAYDCVIDRSVPLDAAGYFTIAVSTANNRPLNAQPECGVAWLPWGPDLTISMIMRNMLPAANFPHSVQAADQGTEKDTLAEYYPTVTYYATAADFERAVGCRAPAYLPDDGAAPTGAVNLDDSGGGGAIGDALLILLGLMALARRGRHRA